MTPLCRCVLSLRWCYLVHWAGYRLVVLLTYAVATLFFLTCSLRLPACRSCLFFLSDAHRLFRPYANLPLPISPAFAAARAFSLTNDKAATSPANASVSHCLSVHPFASTLLLCERVIVCLSQSSRPNLAYPPTALETDKYNPQQNAVLFVQEGICIRWGQTKARAGETD